MPQYKQIFLDTANEIFNIFGPVYEFEFCTAQVRPSSPLLQGEPNSTDPCDQLDFPLLNDVDFKPNTKIETLDDMDRLPFPDGIAKTVVCTSALEHVFHPQQAADEMFRILAPGGILLFCMRTRSHSEHKPGNYWYFTPHSVQRLLSRFDASLVGWQGEDHSPHTVYGIGCKTPVCDSFRKGASLFSNRFQTNINKTNEQITWRQKLRQYLADLLSRLSDQPSQNSRQTNFMVHLPIDRQLKSDILSGCLKKGNDGTRLDLET